MKQNPEVHAEEVLPRPAKASIDDRPCSVCLHRNSPVDDRNQSIPVPILTYSQRTWNDPEGIVD